MVRAANCSRTTGRRLMYWLQEHHAYRLSGKLERLGFWRYCFGRGASFPPLDAAVEARLRERFRPEVEAVEELIRPRSVGVESAHRRSARSELRRCSERELILDKRPRVLLVVGVWK